MSLFESPDEEKDRLGWEFELLGQGAFNWVLSASALLRSADLVYGRYIAAAEIQSSLYFRDSAGIPRAVERPPSQKEVLLLPDTSLGPVALMLLGLALENLAKALLVQASPALVTRDDGIEKQRLKGHHLDTLIDACDRVVDEKERKALRVLSQYCIWAGRYPIPTKPVSPTQAADSHGYWARHQLGAPASLWKDGCVVRERLLAKVRAEWPHASV